MRKPQVFFVIFLLILSQATIFNYLKILNIKPNLILISLIIISLFFNLKWSLIFSFALGFLSDIFNTYSLGFSVLLFPLLRFIIIKLSRKISLDNEYIFSAFVGILTIANSLAVRFFLLSLGTNIAIGIFLRSVIIEAIYTALVSFMIFKEIKLK